MTYLSIIYDQESKRVRVFQDTLVIGFNNAGQAAWLENVDKTFHHAASNTLISCNGLNASLALAIELEKNPEVATHDGLFDACYELLVKLVEDQRTKAAIERTGGQANIWLSGFDDSGLRWSTLRFRVQEGKVLLEKFDWREKLAAGKPFSFPKKAIYRTTFDPEIMSSRFPDSVALHASFVGKADIPSRAAESALFSNLLGWHLSGESNQPSIGGELMEYSTDASGAFLEISILKFSDNTQRPLFDEPEHLCYQKLATTEAKDDPAVLHLRRFFEKLKS